MRFFMFPVPQIAQFPLAAGGLIAPPDGIFHDREGFYTHFGEAVSSGRRNA